MSDASGRERRERNARQKGAAVWRELSSSRESIRKSRSRGRAVGGRSLLSSPLRITLTLGRNSMSPEKRAPGRLGSALESGTSGLKLRLRCVEEALPEPTQFERAPQPLAAATGSKALCGRHQTATKTVEPAHGAVALKARPR